MAGEAVQRGEQESGLVSGLVSGLTGGAKGGRIRRVEGYSQEAAMAKAKVVSFAVRRGQGGLRAGADFARAQADRAVGRERARALTNRTGVGVHTLADVAVALAGRAGVEVRARAVTGRAGERRRVARGAAHGQVPLWRPPQAGLRVRPPRRRSLSTRRMMLRLPAW